MPPVSVPHLDLHSFHPLRDGLASPPKVSPRSQPVPSRPAEVIQIYGGSGPHPQFIEHDTIAPELAEVVSPATGPRSYTEARRRLGAPPTTLWAPRNPPHLDWLAACTPPRTPADFTDVHAGNPRVKATPRSLHDARRILGDGKSPRSSAYHPPITDASAQTRAVAHVLFDLPGFTLLTTAKPPEGERAPCAMPFGGRSGRQGNAAHPPLPVSVVHTTPSAAFDPDTGTYSLKVAIDLHELTHDADHRLDAADLRCGIAPHGAHSQYENSTERHAIFTQMAINHALGEALQRPTYNEAIEYEPIDATAAQPRHPIVREALAHAEAEIDARGPLCADDFLRLQRLINLADRGFV